MPKQKITPIIVKNKKTKKRYIKLGRRKFLIQSTASDRYLIKNFVDIIKQLIAQRKRKRISGSKKYKGEYKHEQPHGVGSSLDAAVFNKYTTLNNNDSLKKLENTNEKLQQSLQAEKNKNKNIKILENSNKEVPLLLQAKKNKKLNINDKHKNINEKIEESKKILADTEAQEKELHVKMRQSLIKHEQDAVSRQEKIKEQVKLIDSQNDTIANQSTYLNDLAKQTENLQNQIHAINTEKNAVMAEAEKLQNELIKKQELIKINQEKLDEIGIENKNLSNKKSKLIAKLAKLKSEANTLKQTIIELKATNNDLTIDLKQTEKNLKTKIEQAKELKDLLTKEKSTNFKQIIMDRNLLRDMLSTFEIPNIPTSGPNGSNDKIIANIFKYIENNPKSQISDFVKTWIANNTDYDQIQIDVNDWQKMKENEYKTERQKSKIKPQPLLDEITTPVKLKPANERKLKDKPKTLINSKTTLLNDIKTPKKLKPSTERVLKEKPPTSPEEKFNLEILKRRKDLFTESDLDDSDNDDSWIEGNGLSLNHAGLWNYEINDLMAKYKKYGFSGVYSVDKLNLMPVDSNKNSISFIMNIMPSEIKIGHWIAVYINHNNLEYYDPLGAPPSELFMQNIIPVLKKFAPGKTLQFKINRIRFQRTNSFNCGYFSMHFLVERYNKKSWKDITGYTKLIESIKGEKQIKRFKKQLHLEDFKNITI